MISEEFGTHPGDLYITYRRLGRISQARHWAEYIMWVQMKFSYSEMGKIFGGASHKSMIYGVDKIRKRIDNDPEAVKLYAKLSERVAKKRDEFQ